MEIDEKLLTREEKADLKLRRLFEQAGFRRYAMSRFEPYDLYVENKDFVGLDRIITFSDIGGKLMALKPDVTMSILRRVSDVPGSLMKVYYNENVYRARPGDGAFREIMQSGVECIGDLGPSDIYDVILLAVRALNALHQDNVLTLSHSLFVAGLLNLAGVPAAMENKLLHLVRDKNADGIKKLCRGFGINEQGCALLLQLIGIYGPLEESIIKMSAIQGNAMMRDAVKDLAGVNAALLPFGAQQHVRVDFSIMNNMQYYDGIVFKGYLNGLPGGVLSGGQYSGMLQKMGHSMGAIGFAVYLNELEYLNG